MAPAHLPVPPPIPPTTLALPTPENSHSHRTEIPAWATSFAFHCLAIILLGLLGYKSEIVGIHGPGELALSWQEPSGDDAFGLDAGAQMSDIDSAIEIVTPSNMTELNTSTTVRFAELIASPSELKLKFSAADKPTKKISELSGLLGSGKSQSGQGADFGKGHGYGKTQFFGLESEGNKFVYVFDRSYSMNEFERVPLRAAKQELMSSIEHLQDQQQFYIVFYNHEPRWYEPRGGYSRGRLHFATNENKGRLQEFIYSLRADGGTRHMPALELAINRKPDVIYLLTDGEEKDDLTPQELQRLTRMNSGGASIHVIQFAPEPRPNSTLVQLAKRNRGKHRFIDIERLADRLAGQIAN